jgi:hypothetical protein
VELQQARCCPFGCSCSGFKVPCDDSSDCPLEKYCCAALTMQSVICASAPCQNAPDGGYVELCEPGKTCAVGSCKPTTNPSYLRELDYYTCQ